LGGYRCSCCDFKGPFRTDSVAILGFQSSPDLGGSSKLGVFLRSAGSRFRPDCQGPDTLPLPENSAEDSVSFWSLRSRDAFMAELPTCTRRRFSLRPRSLTEQFAPVVGHAGFYCCSINLFRLVFESFLFRGVPHKVVLICSWGFPLFFFLFFGFCLQYR